MALRSMQVLKEMRTLIKVRSGGARKKLKSRRQNRPAEKFPLGAAAHRVELSIALQRVCYHMRMVVCEGSGVVAERRSMEVL